MSKRWFVHRNNKAMGPWTADAIRTALREGAIDPFDLVNAEGSPVMRELVEVDEIFQSENVDYTQTATDRYETAQEIEAKKKPRGGILTLAEPNIEKRIASGGTNPGAKAQDTNFLGKLRGREKTRLRAPQPPSEGSLVYDRAKSAISENVGTYVDPKRYFLIDSRGRILGPKSAGEIQSLYYRGVLDQNVQVRKNQSDVSVSIVKFVEVYAQAKGGGKRPPVIASHPVPAGGGLPKPGMLQEFRETAVVRAKVVQSSKYLVMFSIISLLVSAGFGLYAYQNSTAQESKAGKKGVIINRGSNRSAKLNERSGTEEKNLAPRAADNSKEEPKQNRDRPEGTVNENGTPIDGGGDNTNQRNDRVDDGRRQNREDLRSRPNQPATDRGNPVNIPRNRVAVVRRPVQALVRPPPVVPIRAPQASPIAALAGKSGQVVTIGTLRFSQNDLTRCVDKCDLTMTDSGGRTIVAKFFMSAFGTKLLAKPNGAVITGRILNGGQSVLVTGVQ
jgi:hypothetical protein